MTCLHISTVSPLYLSGELNALDTQKVEEHLRHCPSCAAAIEQQKRLDRCLREAVLVPGVESARVEARVRLAIHRNPMARWGRVPVLWKSAAAFCGVIVLAFFGYVQYLHLKPAATLRSAATDHRVEVLQKAQRRWQSDPAAIQQLLADRGLSDVPAAGLAPPGYRLDRGKVCLIGGRLMVHLVFQGGPQLVSVFLFVPDRAETQSRAADEVSGVPVQTVNYGPDHIAYIRTARAAAIVVTDQSTGAAILFSRGVSNRL